MVQSVPTTTETPRRNWRQRLVLPLAVLMMGSVLVVRLLEPASPAERIDRLAADLGAETYRRALTAHELGVALEIRPNGAGQAGTTTLAQEAKPGEVVLLHFWASWCPPCLEELPEILALAEALHDRPFRLVAVSYDDDWAAADSALRRAGARVPPQRGVWLRDPAGQDGDPATMLRTRLGTDQLPETYVIVDGKVRARFIAGQKWTSAKMLQLFDMLAPARTAGAK